VRFQSSVDNNLSVVGRNESVSGHFLSSFISPVKCESFLFHVGNMPMFQRVLGLRWGCFVLICSQPKRSCDDRQARKYWLISFHQITRFE